MTAGELAAAISALYAALVVAGMQCDAMSGGVVDASVSPSEWCDRRYLAGVVEAQDRKGKTVAEVVAIVRLAVGDPQAEPPVAGDSTQLLDLLSKVI